MKNLAIMIAIFAMGIMNVIGQQNTDTISNTPADSTKVKNFSFSGNAKLSSKNFNAGTGIMFEEAFAFIGNANFSLDYKKFGVSACYMAHSSLTGTQTTYNLIDVMGTYKVTDEFSVNVGYEFTYWDHPTEKDECGNNIFAMFTLKHENFSSTTIIFTDILCKNFIYLIESANYQLTDHLSLNGIVAYTNTKASRVYVVGGAKYTMGHVSIGAYGMIDKDTPGGVFQLEFTL